jgi:RimJ/RimL family protein N-acetyltransferase
VVGNSHEVKTNAAREAKSRVRLEPLSAKHVDGLDALARDPDVQRHTYVPSPPPPGFGSSWLERYEQGRADGTRVGFAIVEADDGSFLGLAAAVRLDARASEAELGYILAPEARGRGAATEALRLLTEWGFARGLQRLELRVDAENAPSRRVAERCGYTREGLLRSVYFKEGRRSDMLVYSRLPSD